MSALKKQFHDYLVECVECTRDVKRGERCECGASSLMVDRVNESFRKAHERGRQIAPVIVRKAK